MRQRGLAPGLALVTCAWVAAAFPALVATAQGGPAGNIVVSPSSLEFGSSCAGRTSSAQSFTITNTASGNNDDLHVSSITRTGSADFSFTDPTPITLGPGRHTSFAVTFSPSDHGTRSASFAISSDDPDTPTRNVSAAGAGIDRRLSSDRPTASFGDQRVGTRSPSQSLVIRNQGEDTVTVSSVKRVGANPNDFIVTTPSPPFTIQKGNFRTLSVSFQPSGPGIRRAAIEFTSDACASSKLNVSLVGTGIVPDVLVEPNPINAGTSPRGTQGSATPVTISNKGATALKVTAVQITGINAGDFTLSGLPVMPATVLPNDSFVFSVRMTPSAAGARAASLKVISDDPDSPAVTVPIQGRGSGASSSSASPSNAPSPTRSPSVAPSASPRALGGRSGDTLAVWLVVGGVLVAFLVLILIRRWIVAGDEEE